jgi:hypothetical protein
MTLLCSQCLILGVLLACELYTHNHNDYLFSQRLKMLGFIRCTASSSSTAHPVRPKVDCVSVVLNSVTSTVSSQLKRVEREFAAFCHSRFLSAYFVTIIKLL